MKKLYYLLLFSLLFSNQIFAKNPKISDVKFFSEDFSQPESIFNDFKNVLFIRFDILLPSIGTTYDCNREITQAVNTTLETYVVTHQFCQPFPITELSPLPANYNKATVDVANVIDAVNDAPITVQSGAIVALVIGNVTGNDTLNGVLVTAANTNVTPSTTGPLSVDANGVLTLAPNTPSGTYTIGYQLCEANPITGSSLIPANCDSATATVIVANIIDSVNDGPINTSSGFIPINLGNVTTNDTLNGVLVTAANTNVTPSTMGPLSVNANGVLTLAQNTPSGTYTLTYQLCEANPITGSSVIPANCDSSIATVIVANVIDAVNNAAISVAISCGSNAVIVSVNVTGNDTLNGNPVTGANTNVTPVTTGPLSVDANGVITLAANTQAGSYSVTYQLCEANPITGLSVLPSNCDVAVATVVVTNISVSAAAQTNILCNGGNNGAASINTPIGGAGGYTYNWTPGNPSGDGTTSITGLTAGTWTCTVTDANFCTANQTFNITQPVAINNAVTQALGILTATQTGATYQWYQCPNTILSGANNQTYIPTVVGNYKVDVSIGGCIVTSTCINITVLGTTNFEINSKLKIYPNPANNNIKIDIQDLENANVEVFDSNGRVLFVEKLNKTSNTINIENLASGMYLFKVTSNQGSATSKVIKTN